jgi:hypothetical protein
MPLSSGTTPKNLFNFFAQTKTPASVELELLNGNRNQKLNTNLFGTPRKRLGGIDDQSKR